MTGKWRHDLIVDESIKERVAAVVAAENRSINNAVETLILRGLAATKRGELSTEQ